MRTGIACGIALLLLFILPVGCSPKKEKTAVTADDASNPAIRQFLEGGLDFPLGKSVDEIKKNLGPPSSEQVEEVKIPSVPGRKEEIHRLAYDGLTVEVDKVAGSGARESLVRLVITDGKYKTAMGLKIGSTENDVKHVLGEPWGVVNDALIYEEDAGALTFYVQKGTVQKIQWEWYPE